MKEKRDARNSTKRRRRETMRYELRVNDITNDCTLNRTFTIIDHTSNYVAENKTNNKTKNNERIIRREQIRS